MNANGSAHRHSNLEMFHKYALHYCSDPLKDKMPFYNVLFLSAVVTSMLCMVSNGIPNPGVTVNVNVDIDTNAKNVSVDDRSVGLLSK